MQDHLNQLNEQEKAEKNCKVLVPFSPSLSIPKNEAQSWNIGYLFFQIVYYNLCIELIAAHVTKIHLFQYDMNRILSRLVYGRIIFPSSKLSTCRSSHDLLEAPGFEYHQVERALSVIASEFNSIQAELYEFSSAVILRKTGVLYYDCTNFYFETEQEDDIPDEVTDGNDTVA